MLIAPLLEEERHAGDPALVAEGPTQVGCIGREPPPLSPPTMIQCSR